MLSTMQDVGDMISAIGLVGSGPALASLIKEMGPALLKLKDVDIMKLVRGKVESGGSTNVNTGDVAGGADAEFGIVPIREIAKFETLGIKGDVLSTTEGRAMFSEYKKLGFSDQKAIGYTESLINSGSTLPIKKTINEPLYKIVAKGEGVKDTSPYWLTKFELNLLKADPKGALEKLGLPLENQSVKFDIFEMKSKGNATVFESTIAPTRQGIVSQTGGAIQTLVTDRSQFTSPVRIETIELE